MLTPDFASLYLGYACSAQSRCRSVIGQLQIGPALLAHTLCAVTIGDETLSFIGRSGETALVPLDHLLLG